MTTLPVQAPVESRLWALPHVILKRVATIVTTVIDVYDEAQRQGREAERKYPFASW